MGGYSSSHYRWQECDNCGNEFQSEFTEQYCDKCDGAV